MPMQSRTANSPWEDKYKTDSASDGAHSRSLFITSDNWSGVAVYPAGPDLHRSPKIPPTGTLPYTSCIPTSGWPQGSPLDPLLLDFQRSTLHLLSRDRLWEIAEKPRSAPQLPGVVATASTWSESPDLHKSSPN
jgi:hypothetical protein